MDTPAKQMEKPTMEFATTRSVGSQSAVDLLAISLMCWHMKYSMLVSLTLQKNQLTKPLGLLMKHMVLFPNSSLPDMGDDWEEEDEEIYK